MFTSKGALACTAGHDNPISFLDRRIEKRRCYVTLVVLKFRFDALIDLVAHSATTLTTSLFGITLVVLDTLLQTTSSQFCDEKIDEFSFGVSPLNRPNTFPAD